MTLEQYLINESFHLLKNTFGIIQAHKIYENHCRNYKADHKQELFKLTQEGLGQQFYLNQAWSLLDYAKSQQEE